MDSPSDVAATASEIYKRGVEAYRGRSRKPLRERYDRAMGRGKLRIERLQILYEVLALEPP